MRAKLFSTKNAIPRASCRHGSHFSCRGAPLVSCGGKCNASTPPPASYKLAWGDEFSGPDGASPDSSKWIHDVRGNGWGNNELEYYTNRTQNAQIKAGNLVITAQKKPTPAPTA